MGRVGCIAVVGCVLALAAPAAGQGKAKAKAAKVAPKGKAAAKMAAPQPPPEMAQLKYFTGTWRCDATSYPPIPGQPPRKISATSRMKLELDGFWMVEHYKQRKTKANPLPQKAIFIYGYNAQKKRFESSFLNNFGARAHLSTPGWQGDRWQEEGTMVVGGKRMKIRATFVKINKRKFSVLAELSGPKGWIKLEEGECRR